ncbi:DNA-binding transcriptional regulator, AcrR family [Mycolicibacterium rutilum]|uniref:DNA-binding transcriptional regulator, AcrR family n=1 Tax=Mycolicibacterium rutilum TaxID=370526 RepID=A0A1H6L7Z5_MYCRU|nr:TetR/AcrR family transcriptional regulator [Mycolicibacterium rutilum]SEH84575.1 DNA-binding transcriptional regulator, AcrR family [Mycolicibacterium rutilum]
MVERADARRNRERLLAAATAAFAAGNGAVALEAIARDAGVGIGTLYRHFPTREALVEAVYRTELAEVSALAPALLERHPPAVALRRWMDRYAEFVAAKKGMEDSLRAIVTAGAVEPNETRESIVGAVGTLLEAGIADGTLRDDVLADDIVMSMLGVLLTSGSREQSGRMLDLLMDGLTVRG